MFPNDWGLTGALFPNYSNIILGTFCLAINTHDEQQGSVIKTDKFIR